MTFVDYISIWVYQILIVVVTKMRKLCQQNRYNQLVLKFLQLFVFHLNLIYSNWLKTFVRQIHKVTYFLTYYFS